MRSFVLLPLLVTSVLAAQAPKPAPAHPAPGQPAPAAVPAGAPAPPRATLTGTVFDSLNGNALAGAIVVASSSAITATTDAEGHYQFDADSLESGWHTLSFFHATLDSLGIAAPTRSVDLVRGVSAVVDLAVPSAATVTRSFCPDSLRGDSYALLLGEVRNADADQPLPGGLVVVMWSSMEVGNNSLTRLPRALNARADSNGFFRICGIPPQTNLRAQARLDKKASGWIDLVMDPGGVTVVQMLVGERHAAPVPTATVAAGAAGTATPAAPVALGSAVLTGTIVGGDGVPLEGAQVFINGTNLSARADYRGNFRLGGLPAGTQTVEVRLLSYQPKRYTVNLSAQKESRLNAVLDQRAQVLDPVVVTAEQTSVVPGFDERRMRLSGTFFTKQDLERAGVEATTNLLRTARGIQVMFVNGKYLVTVTRSLSSGCQSVQWYVDGMRWSATQTDDINEQFPPSELEAIEVYASATDTPPQYVSSQAICGTVLLWTSRAHPKKKAPPGGTTPP